MQEDQHSLKSGTILEKYKIIRILGEGSFGITYLAEDIHLGLKVVIKEYFPNEFAMRTHENTITAKSKSIESFKKGKQRFKEEAQILAKFNHPSIVKILGYFEVNDTAYFVMEYEEGMDLSQYLKEQNRALSQEEILSIMMPILEGLKEVHTHKYLHRDIKPGNILLRNNKSPVLIDFGASKLAIGEASKSITSMLTEGYAPLEQYSTDIKKQGPYTDLYAIAAVMYKMITGAVPPSSQTRSYALLTEEEDPYKKLVSLELKGYDESFLKAVDRALFISAKERPQNVQEFQQDIAGELELKQVEASQVNIEPEKNTNKTDTQKNNNGILMGLLVLILIAGGTLGYMLLQKKDLPQKVVTVEKKNVGKVQEKKQPKITKKIKVEKEEKEAEVIVKKVMEEVEKEKGVVKPNVTPVTSKPKNAATDRFKAEQIIFEKLRNYGNIRTYGFDYIVNQYPNVKLKHSIIGFYNLPFSSGKHIVSIASTAPEKNFNAHVFAPKLSFFEFEVINGEWIIKREYINALQFGSWGRAPDAKDIQVVEWGRDRFGLMFDSWYSTLGYTEEMKTLYILEDSKVRDVFSEEVASDDSGTGNNQKDWKATFNFDTDSTPFYDIILHKKGLEDGKQIDEKIVYKYNGQKYIKQVKNKVQTINETPKCTYFSVSSDVKQLNIRNKPGKPSKVVGKANQGDTVCIYEFNGKWGRSDRGWISRKYLDKDILKNNYLLADIDNDGKDEKLQWKLFSTPEDAYMEYYQLKLYDDDETLLWTGPKTDRNNSLIASRSDGGDYMPVILQDIDGDGNIELIMGGSPNEPISPVIDVYRWDGKTFNKVQNQLDLVWVDSPYGNTLRWMKIKYPNYDAKKSKKIWWAYGFEQSLNEEFSIVTIEGVKYPDTMPFFNAKVKIRFTRTGAIIEEWIK